MRVIFVGMSFFTESHRESSCGEYFHLIGDLEGKIADGNKLERVLNDMEDGGY